MGVYKLNVWKCSEHNWYALYLDDEGGGLRLLPAAKCCGRWDQLVTGWDLTADGARKIIEELVCALDEIERVEEEAK